MQCLILAGGLGTRLGEITRAIPKPLIPIQGKPFLSYQLEDLKRQGVDRVVVSVGYKAEQFVEFLGDGSRWGLQIRIVNEGENLLGTGGAVRFAVDHSDLGEKFFMIYGDSFLQVNYKKIWDWFENRGEEMLMTVMKNEDQWDLSNCCFDGNKVTLYDKTLKGKNKPKEMVFIDYGLSIFRKSSILKGISAGKKSDLSDYVSPLSRRGEVAGFEIHDRFFEIGSPQGLEDFSKRITGLES